MAWDIIPVEDFTQAKVDGTGVYDILMKANSAHLEQEFSRGRIKGPEYSEVYLGVMQGTMNTALAFLVQQNKLALEAKLMETQILIAEAQLAQAAIALQIAQLQLQKVPAEIALLEAQADNLKAEGLNIPKQGEKIDADTAAVIKQTEMITQQIANAVIEGTVLTAQKCKLDAEYDVLVGSKLKVVAETELLNQKVTTEKAQTSGAAIDPTSVVGKQVALYTAQTDGFARDAEQKAAKTLIDTWNVRRTTDEATEANALNQLQDTSIGRAVAKLLTGVGA